MKQHDYILLDRSGSMQRIWDEAMGSVASYVKKLKDDKVKTVVTFATFDTDGGQIAFDVLSRGVSLKEWKKPGKSVVPRGMTPLNDAVSRLVALAEQDEPERAAIIIMTDGHENASREWNTENIKAKLDACRAKGWQVIFLGANFDNRAQAATYGNAMGQTLSGIKPENMVRSTVSVASARAVYGASGQAMSFSESQKRRINTGEPKTAAKAKKPKK